MVSEMGDWIGLIGVAALLYQRTGLALAASASLAALYLPYLFAPWLVGWTARIAPRTLLIGADFLRAGLIILLFLPLPPWALLGLVFLASVPTSVYDATRAAAVPEYAPDEETREDALVLFQSTQQAASMLGFLVGGAALVVTGFAGAIALNAISFLVSGLLLFGVPRLAPFADPAETARGLLRSGVKALRGRHLLRQAVLLSVISASTIMAGEALVVVYASDIGHPGLAGPLAAFASFIAAICGLLLPRHQSSHELMRFAALTMLAGGIVAIFGFGLSPGAFEGTIGYLGLGIVSAPGALTYVVAVREMRAAIRASVFAMVQVGLMGGQAAVAVLAGRLADVTSVGTSVALWQIPTVAYAFWALATTFGPSIRRSGRHEGPEERRGAEDWLPRETADADGPKPARAAPLPAEPIPQLPAPSAVPVASRGARAPETPALPTRR